jgi:hypothetical protein
MGFVRIKCESDPGTSPDLGGEDVPTSGAIIAPIVIAFFLASILLLYYFLVVKKKADAAAAAAAAAATAAFDSDSDVEARHSISSPMTLQRSSMSFQRTSMSR